MGRYQYPLRSTVDNDPEHQNWKLSAVCRGHDPVWWEPRTRLQARRGKAICRGCPVTGECLEYSLATDSRFGTWGGLDQWERADLTSRRVRR